MRASKKNISHVWLPKTEVLQIGGAYGGRPFWREVLVEDSNPRNIWRALLFASCTQEKELEKEIGFKLFNPDSRVRAWACVALGRLRSIRHLAQLRGMHTDPSPRVRYRANQAYLEILGRGSHYAARAAVPNGRRLILLSDDSRRVRQQLERYLDGSRYDFIHTAHVDETLSTAKSLQPFAVITDNQKGRDNTSGLRMASAFASDPNLQEILLFMISADMVGGVFFWHGGDEYFLKWPTSFPRISKALDAYAKA